MGDEAALSMGIMLWAGILVVVFVLLLLAVDVTCYFVNKCGLIMCLCGKSGTGTKGHNLEEGKAAFVKDESKEPIVEVRTEDECTANHNAAGPTEPNETTPLTEPELAAYTAALAQDTLSSVATNSDTATATIDPAQDSPSSETTTLTCSLSTPANEPSPAPVPAAEPDPPTPPAQGKTPPPVERRRSNAPEEAEKISTPPPTPDQVRPQKAGTPIPPKRRHSPKLAALNAKSSPPVSPLAASSPSPSPTLDTKKPAPRPPVSKLPTQPPTAALETDAPAQTASTRATTAPANADPDFSPAAPDPGACGLPAFDTDRPPDYKTPAAAAVTGGGLEDLDDSLVAGVASALPVTPIPPSHVPSGLEAPLSNDFLMSASDTYDLLTPDAGPKHADLDLELMNGTERPSLPPADLISLDSPPAAPSLPNGDGADPPSGPVLEASETLAKTAPPVNDEKIFCDEKGKLEEADLPNTLITADHNSVTQTNTTESKA